MREDPSDEEILRQMAGCSVAVLVLIVVVSVAVGFAVGVLVS